MRGTTGVTPVHGKAFGARVARLGRRFKVVGGRARTTQGLAWRLDAVLHPGLATAHPPPEAPDHPLFRDMTRLRDAFVTGLAPAVAA